MATAAAKKPPLRGVVCDMDGMQPAGAARAPQRAAPAALHAGGAATRRMCFQRTAASR